MKDDKRAFSLIFGLMFATILFIVGLAIAPTLQDVTGEVRDNTALNCSSTTDAQTKAVCTSIDIQQLFVGIIFGVAGLIVWRLV